MVLHHEQRLSGSPSIMTWLTLRGLAGKRLMAPKCTSAQSLACLIFSIVVYVKVLGRAWGTYTMETFHLLYVDRCVAFATHNPWNNESDEWWNITPLKKWIKNMIFSSSAAKYPHIRFLWSFLACSTTAPASYEDLPFTGSQLGNKYFSTVQH